MVGGVGGRGGHFVVRVVVVVGIVVVVVAAAGRLGLRAESLPLGRWSPGNRRGSLVLLLLVEAVEVNGYCVACLLLGLLEMKQIDEWEKTKLNVQFAHGQSGSGFLSLESAPECN